MTKVEIIKVAIYRSGRSVNRFFINLFYFFYRNFFLIFRKDRCIEMKLDVDWFKVGETLFALIGKDEGVYLRKLGNNYYYLLKNQDEEGET